MKSIVKAITNVIHIKSVESIELPSLFLTCWGRPFFLPVGSCIDGARATSLTVIRLNTTRQDMGPE